MVFHYDVVQTLNPIVDVGIDRLVESGVNAFCTLLTEKAEPHSKNGTTCSSNMCILGVTVLSGKLSL